MSFYFPYVNLKYHNVIGMSADARRQKPTRRKEVERSVAEKKESHRDEVSGGTNRKERSEGGTAPIINFKKSNTIGLKVTSYLYGGPSSRYLLTVGM